MYENLKIVLVVFCAFTISLSAFSIFLGFYDSGGLYESEWEENFKLVNFFDKNEKNINPKHVSLEFLKKMFGE
tara:strand:- start:2731 stop:2949 length:219 start_codon:yes stop_codon:yes gene_type:complete